MNTIKDVAILAGVSASTVSRALSGKIPVDIETKKRVIEAVKQLNYRPNVLAKGLKEGKTNTIGLIIPNIRNPIFPAVARGVEDVARKNGYTVILCNTDENLETELDYVNKLQNRWVDGLIFATASKESRHITELYNSNFPVVLLIRKLEENIDSVVLNNFSASHKAVSLLIENGCRKIAFINGNPEINVYKERLAGFIEAHKEYGIPLDKRRIIEGVSGNRGGYAACKSILESGIGVDGIFAASDRKAIGAVRAIQDSKLRVPDDVKVIGFDDIETSEMMEPPLTTMAQPTYEMGAMAMQRLIKIINGKKKQRPVLSELEAKLIVRKTT